eukprot:scpid110503/ scgid11340/ 
MSLMHIMTRPIRSCQTCTHGGHARSARRTANSNVLQTHSPAESHCDVHGQTRRPARLQCTLTCKLHHHKPSRVKHTANPSSQDPGHAPTVIHSDLLKVLAFKTGFLCTLIMN